MSAWEHTLLYPSRSHDRKFVKLSQDALVSAKNLLESLPTHGICEGGERTAVMRSYSTETKITRNGAQNNEDSEIGRRSNASLTNILSN